MGHNDYIILIVSSIAGVTDLKHGKIFNWLTYPAIALGLVLAVVEGGGSIWESASGFAIGFVPLFFVNQMGGIGGGDVKLMGALGALAGYLIVLHIMFYSFLLGGIVALSIITWQGRFIDVMKRMMRNLFFLSVPGSRLVVEDDYGYKMPFGFAICMGTLWTLLLKVLNTSLI